MAGKRGKVWGRDERWAERDGRYGKRCKVAGKRWKRWKVAGKRGKVWGRDERWPEREGRYGEEIEGGQKEREGMGKR